MPLPQIAPPRTTITVADASIPIRSLTRSEVKGLRELEAGRSGDAYLVALCTGETEEDAAAWLGTLAPVHATSAVIQCLAFSGLRPLVSEEEVDPSEDPSTGSTPAPDSGTPSDEP